MEQHKHQANVYMAELHTIIEIIVVYDSFVDN